MALEEWKLETLGTSLDGLLDNFYAGTKFNNLASARIGLKSLVEGVLEVYPRAVRLAEDSENLGEVGRIWKRFYEACSTYVKWSSTLAKNYAGCVESHKKLDEIRTRTYELWQLHTSV